MARRLAYTLLLLAGIVLSLALVESVVAADPVRTDGTASWFGPGHGVATQWCTWTLRHSEGCGMLAVQSHATGITVIVPVIDWCECYRGTDRERIVDLQLGVVAALGLDPADGLYPVTTWRVPPGTHGATVPAPASLPNTAMPREVAIPMAVLLGALAAAAVVLVVNAWRQRP